MTEVSTIKISVRKLVEFVYRSGDFISVFTSHSRALLGTLGHQRVQKSRPDNYEAEVSLSHKLVYNDTTMIVQGRADGIYSGENITVDEIKTTTKDLATIDQQDNQHYWAQAKVYAYIYALQNDLDSINIQLTYYNVENFRKLEFVEQMDFATLETFFTELISKYGNWAQKLSGFAESKYQSITDLSFPFEKYRTGQRELAVYSYKSIREQEKLFVQAPTGTGKTIGVLFPAIKALAEAHTERIFYLTSKTVGRMVAEDTVKILLTKGMKTKSITLTAKDKICFSPDAACHPDECPYAKGYYDKLNLAMDEIFQHNLWDRECVKSVAQKHQICPFEFSLELALYADIIICDYNYAFDPRVYLRRFFDNADGKYTFLIDEAHNLADRAREMFSAEIYKADVLALKRELKDEWKSGARLLNAINTELLTKRKLCDEQSSRNLIDKDKPEKLIKTIDKFCKEAEKWLLENPQSGIRENLLDFYFQCLTMLRVDEMYDRRYISYFEKLSSGNLKARLFCLDPSHLLKKAMKRSTTSIMFSATLSPMNYFRTILGGKEQDNGIKLPSPFPPENLAVTVHSGIQTTYKSRENFVENIVTTLGNAIDAYRGNYLVYFPSYKYMNKVYEQFIKTAHASKIIVQQNSMSELEREEFLENFSADNPNGLLAFAVMGGIFGEGIDLVGEKLSGVIIVGVGLPQLCLERDQIKDFYDSENAMGFEYAYMYPGMNKVLQAAGRVIRDENDKGMIMLLDQRFSHTRYQRLMPAFWENILYSNNDQKIAKTLDEFWNTSSHHALRDR